MKKLNIENIKAAIKVQKWDKASYYYAVSNMQPHYIGSCDSFLKTELIERFYNLIETKFSLIAGYTTFKGIDCYINEEVDYSNLPQTGDFVVTKDYLSVNSGSTPDFVDATEEQKAQIKKDGYTVHFMMYDDDDVLYYGGYLKTELEGTEDAFAPLDYYGMPNAGCTDIKYREKDGTYSTL